MGSRAVQEYINSFGGNIPAALKALQEYASQNPQRVVAKRTIDPSLLGPVVVEIEGVKKFYKVGKQQIHALAGVSLQIHQGEFIAITGGSGSGKSTLLQLMGGLDKPTEGVITVDGVNLSKLRDGKLSTFRNQTIGFVFQFFYLQPFLKIGTNLELPGMFARTKRGVRRQKAQELSRAVGIENRLQHLPSELSGGQMQRAAIARALLNNPKILLADEPTGNLDSTNGEAIIELFETIRKEFGTTVIVVTHDAEIAARADREIRLKDGVVI